MMRLPMKKEEGGRTKRDDYTLGSQNNQIRRQIVRDNMSGCVDKLTLIRRSALQIGRLHVNLKTSAIQTNTYTT
jgi:hypothetical protein